MNIFGRVGGRTVSETVRGLPGRRQQGEEPGGRPLTLSPAVWREAGPHPELPARRACFSPACSGRCVLGESGTAPWTPLAPLRLSPHSGHRSTSGALSPGRGPSQSLGAGRSHLQAHAVSSAIPPSAPRPLRTPPRLPRGAVTPRRGCPVTPALHSARGCCHLVPLPVAP